jgi:hypothetical protein
MSENRRCQISLDRRAIHVFLFLATMAWTGRPIDIQRDLLIGFDLLLVLVVCLVLYSASARDPAAPPNLFDWLQLLLIVSALVVDAVALAAIASRISEFGFTPNRVAARGEPDSARQFVGVGVALHRVLTRAQTLPRARDVADCVPTGVFNLGGAGRRAVPAAVRVRVKARSATCA